jgi:threonylcarbamoyladenosine tRNA methylthiotransferase CDKAL1
MKAYVEAYGCTLNFGESREIEDLLVERGWEIVDDPKDSDLVVLATCVVIETTERAMLKRIAELSKGPRLVVTGCMATVCREKVQKVSPSAAFVAPGDLESFSRLVESYGSRRALKKKESESFSIVPIATGCRGACSYCITRLARGELKSRSPSRIIDAVKHAAASGPREIQLTAQDTAAYGLDIGTDLPTLVKGVCKVPLDFRLRVGMMNPRSALPMVDRIAGMYLEHKVFKFLHLPLQSASDRLLEHMERGYSVDDFRAIISRIREYVPFISVSTDLIVGYPGESEEDHRENLSIVSELKPDIVNVTRFSSRPGTKAAEANGRVVGWKAKDRSREITELRFQVALGRNKSWIDKAFTALSTERGKNRSTILRSDEYKQVVVPEQLPLGRYYTVKVIDATPTYLIGARAGD